MYYSYYIQSLTCYSRSICYNDMCWIINKLRYVIRLCVITVTSFTVNISITTMTMIFISRFVYYLLWFIVHIEYSSGIHTNWRTCVATKAIFPQAPMKQKLQKDTCITSFCEGKKQQPRKENGRDW